MDSICWIEIEPNVIYRSIKLNNPDCGCTVILSPDALHVIDIGDGVDWTKNAIMCDDALNIIDTDPIELFRNHLIKTRTISISFSHFHPDHWSGFNQIMEFILTLVFLQDEIITLNLHARIPSKDKSEMVERGYFCSDYYARLCGEMLESIEKLERSLIILQNNDQKTELDALKLSYTQKKLEFYRKTCIFLNQLSKYSNKASLFNDIMFSKPFLDKKLIVRFHNEGYSEIKNPNLNWNWDGSHSPEHIWGELQLEGKRILLLGDIFPIEKTLNDKNFSDEEKLIKCLIEIRAKINQSGETIVGFSHAKNFQELSKYTNTIRMELDFFDDCINKAIITFEAINKSVSNERELNEILYNANDFGEIDINKIKALIEGCFLKYLNLTRDFFFTLDEQERSAFMDNLRGILTQSVQT